MMVGIPVLDTLLIVLALQLGALGGIWISVACIALLLLSLCYFREHAKQTLDRQVLTDPYRQDANAGT